MRRLLKHKLVKLTIVSTLAAAILITPLLATPHLVLAFADGCYTDSTGQHRLANSACSGQTDIYGNPIDPTKHCYIQEVQPPASGSSGASSISYQQVFCSTLSAQINTTTDSTPVNACGSGKEIIYTSIDFGCNGEVCNPHAANYKPTDKYCQSDHNAIVDLLFAVIRFLSDGVGLLVVASIILAGIQYMTARSDPKAAANAIGRIRSSLVALLIYIFAYAILNYIIPIGFFHQ